MAIAGKKCHNSLVGKKILITTANLASVLASVFDKLNFRYLKICSFVRFLCYVVFFFLLFPQLKGASLVPKVFNSRRK